MMAARASNESTRPRREPARPRCRWWRGPTLGLVVALGATGVAGQVADVRFRTLALDDGLSQSSVESIVQDHRGFMWFATQEGLNRYDGYDFKVYRFDPADPTSLSHHTVWALHEDRDGRLWAGTRSGLNLFDRDRESFVRFLHDPADPTSLPHPRVRAIYEDGRGRLWVATEGGGLGLLDRATGTFRPYRHDPADPRSLNHDVVRAIHEGRDGRMWFGTDGGLALLDPAGDGFTRFVHDPEDPGSLSSNDVTSILQAGDGRLWVGTDGGGLNALDPKTGRVERFGAGPIARGALASDRVTSIREDRSGTLWVGTLGGGLHRRIRPSDVFVPIRHDPEDPWSLGDDRVLTVYEDRGGILWVGTRGAGVGRSGRNVFKFTSYEIQPTAGDALSHDHVRAFAVVPDGLWVATEGGGLTLVTRDRPPEHYHHDPADPSSLSDNDVFSLLRTRDGSLWIGTRGGWINRFDGDGTFTRHRVSGANGLSLAQNQVRALLEDRDGTLWVGSMGGGLQAFDREAGTFRPYFHSPEDPWSLASDDVFTLYQDAAGDIWVGMGGAGVDRFDPAGGTFEHFRNEPDDPTTISSDYVMAVLETEAGDLWMATYGGGLNRFDRSSRTFERKGAEHGLSNVMLYGMVEDNRGLLWASHNQGISRFDPRLDRFTNYDVRDGLQSNEFNGGAYHRSPDGSLYFGGIRGYNLIRPSEVLDSPHRPTVVLTGFELFNRGVPIGEMEDGRTVLRRSITETDRIELSYKDYVVSFEYAALGSGVPEKDQYAYRLEPMESEWNEVGDRRFATYTNLKPGRYEFLVKAANGDGVWSDEPTRLSIVVTPPFWMTWWFRGLAALIVALSITAVYRIRVRALRRRERHLEREVAARTSELEEQKAHLEQTLVELKEARGELIDAAHKAGMADIATGVLHNVGNILNSVSASASVIRDRLRGSKVAGLGKANGLLRENLNDLPGFFADDPRGEKLARYYLELESAIVGEHDELEENTARLMEKIRAITDVIGTQQRFAKRDSFMSEALPLREIIEDALELSATSIDRHGIEVELRLDDVPDVVVQKSKLVHVIVNLVKNAKDAMVDADSPRRTLVIDLIRDEDSAYVRVTDSGPGIAPDALDRIFTHGFTTKSEGHGFGLHSSANYLAEMGGRLWAESEGIGFGARFILELPLVVSGTGTESGDEDVEGRLAAAG